MGQVCVEGVISFALHGKILRGVERGGGENSQRRKSCRSYRFGRRRRTWDSLCRACSLYLLGFPSRVLLDGFEVEKIDFDALLLNDIKEKREGGEWRDRKSVV